MQSFATSSGVYPAAPGTSDLTPQTAAGERVQDTLRIPAQYDGQTASLLRGNHVEYRLVVADLPHNVAGEPNAAGRRPLAEINEAVHGE
jgi:hypothetical protein